MSLSDYGRIEAAIHYLEQHADQQPALDQVAQQVGLSKYHFQRLFVRWAGVSPKRFLQFLTLERAKARLARAETVLETSHAVGLSGPGRLHDLFVTIEAVTPGEVRRLGAGLEIRYGIHPSPFGQCLLATTHRGLCELRFVDPDQHDAAVAALRAAWPRADVRRDPSTTAPLAEQIFGPIEAIPPEPIAVYLRGSPFQLLVWRALLRVPAGAVVSYQQLARMADRPRATRAVGSAMAHNPVSYLIPCHRVIRSTGHPGHYGGGAARKKALIAWEAAKTNEDDSA